MTDYHMTVDISIKDIENLDRESAVNEIENIIYTATSLIERLEGAGKIYGNGHHIRQRIAGFAVQQIEKNWKE